jgi:ASC-1-like (ASCH) protein
MSSTSKSLSVRLLRESREQLNLRKPYLKLIADGIKTVEVRVGYPKMHRIQAGHELTFVSGDDTVVTPAKRVTEYDSFEALLDIRIRLPSAKISAS